MNTCSARNAKHNQYDQRLYSYIYTNTKHNYYMQKQDGWSYGAVD